MYNVCRNSCTASSNLYVYIPVCLCIIVYAQFLEMVILCGELCTHPVHVHVYGKSTYTMNQSSLLGKGQGYVHVHVCV